ncbi:MAG: outer membrane protein [Variibacter sp.]
MRAVLAAAFGGVFLATAAVAADMPVKGYAPIAPTQIWSGFYAGLNAGYLWSSQANEDSALGGAQLGYNWQSGQLVAGVEIDLQALSLDGTGTVSNAAGTMAIRETLGIDYFGTARARLGFASGPWLFYATGGAAFTTINHDGSGVTGVVGNYSASKSKVGWTAGGGVEWMFAPRWSAKAEYLHMEFSGDTITYNTTTPAIAITYSDAKADVVRAGINYHF